MLRDSDQGFPKATILSVTRPGIFIENKRKMEQEEIPICSIPH